jgi:hypothetical protein
MKLVVGGATDKLCKSCNAYHEKKGPSTKICLVSAYRIKDLFHPNAYQEGIISG